MLALINLLLLAFIDIAIPIFTVEAIASKRLELKKFMIIYAFLLFMLVRMYFKTNYILIASIFYIIVFIYFKTAKKIFSFRVPTCYFILLNIMIIAFSNLLSIFLNDSFIKPIYHFNGYFQTCRIESVYKQIYIIILFSFQILRMYKSGVIKNNYLYHTCFFILLNSIGLMLIMQILIDNNNVEQETLFSFFSSITICIFFVFYYFFKSLYDVILENKKAKSECNLLIEDQEHMREINKFKHDLQNNFIVLRHLVDERKFEEVTNYLDKYIAKYEKINHHIEIDNIIVSAIINEKIYEYENIVFKIQCHIPRILNIDDLDLVIILGNILDNSCEYLKINNISHPLYVNINTHLETELFIEVKNKFMSNRLSDFDFKTRKTDKNFHGIGLTNVKQTVDKYEGIYNLILEEDLLITRILIPNGGVRLNM